MFRDCVSFPAQPIPPGNVDEALALIRDLKNVGDVREIIRLLAPRAG